MEQEQQQELEEQQQQEEAKDDADLNMEHHDLSMQQVVSDEVDDVTTQALDIVDKIFSTNGIYNGLDAIANGVDEVATAIVPGPSTEDAERQSPPVFVSEDENIVDLKSLPAIFGANPEEADQYFDMNFNKLQEITKSIDRPMLHLEDTHLSYMIGVPAAIDPASLTALLKQRETDYEYVKEHGIEPGMAKCSECDFYFPEEACKVGSFNEKETFNKILAIKKIISKGNISSDETKLYTSILQASTAFHTCPPKTTSTRESTPPPQPVKPAFNQTVGSTPGSQTNYSQYRTEQPPQIPPRPNYNGTQNWNGVQNSNHARPVLGARANRSTPQYSQQQQSQQQQHQQPHQPQYQQIQPIPLLPIQQTLQSLQYQQQQQLWAPSSLYDGSIGSFGINGIITDPQQAMLNNTPYTQQDIEQMIYSINQMGFNNHPNPYN